MDWDKIIIVIIVAALGFFLYRGRNGIKQIFKESEAAPKYWGTFGIIVLLLCLFVYFLIKL